MEIRVLTGQDASSCRSLRLEGLRDFPAAFASSYDEEREIAVATIAKRLEPSENGAVFGALDREGAINLWVNVKNVPAIEMYRRAGFEPSGVERVFMMVDDEPQDLLHMVRLIASA